MIIVELISLSFSLYKTSELHHLSSSCVYDVEWGVRTCTYVKKSPDLPDVQQQQPPKPD